MKSNQKLIFSCPHCSRFVLVLVALFSLCRPTFSQSTVIINGAGATAPYPIYSKWFDQYKTINSTVQINYQSTGSGNGVRQLLDGTIDFGASDGPMNDQQMDQFARGRTVLHLPTVIGGVVPIYNIPGINVILNFTPEVLAAIYLGRITKWDDQMIADVNRGVNLPNANIVVVHRSDGVGTTYVWTDFLSKVSDEWKGKVGVGTSVQNWPVGMGARGNEGVASFISQTPNAIGYVDFTYAVKNNAPYGAIRNASGKFVRANLKNLTETAASSAKNMPYDFRVSITNAAGAESYPICSFTWLMVPVGTQDNAKLQAMINFLKWMLTDGQNYVEQFSYARLPREIVELEEDRLGSLLNAPAVVEAKVIGGISNASSSIAIEPVNNPSSQTKQNDGSNSGGLWTGVGAALSGVATGLSGSTPQTPIPSAVSTESMNPESQKAASQTSASSSSRFVRGLPQCTRTQYESQGATLWIVNNCNVAVTVEMTSDSGNTWGQVNVGSNNRTAATIFGIGYSPQKDGTVYIFTCPQGTQPVLPNGNPFLARSYRGQYTCALQ